MNVLVANGLVKRYSDRKVVNGISVKIRSGEVVGLLGPNGAGKTTCFYMIVGLIPVDTGRIAIDDHDVTDYPMIDIFPLRDVGLIQVTRINGRWYARATPCH